jgi:hypothetical protein
MKAIEKLRASEDMGRKMAIDNDFNKLQYHMRQLELQIKRLREVVLINREIIA